MVRGVFRNSDLIHVYGGVGPVIRKALYEMIFDAVGGQMLHHSTQCSPNHDLYAYKVQVFHHIVINPGIS